MAPAARPHFDSLSKVPLVDPCQCRDCDGACQRKVPKKWHLCRTCTKGYHGIPCEAFQPERWPQIIPECEECGMLEAEH